MAGLKTVVGEIPHETFGVPASPADDAAYSSWQKELLSRNIAWKGLSDGQIIKEGNWSLEVLYSRKLSTDREYNSRSLVLKCKMGHFSVLLTGDLGEEGLQRLDEEGKLGPIEVLKLPHHGSKYSFYLPLYQKTRPSYAVIPVGKHNIFGHPSPIVLQALQEEGIKVLRTDQMGAIVLHSQGSGFEVRVGPNQSRLESNY